MRVIQPILNWFGVALMTLGAVILALTGSAVATPGFMLTAAAPLLCHLFARRREASDGTRVLAMAVNWIAAVLVGSLAAVALTGISEASALFPLLGCAAALYGWNAVGPALTRLS